MIKGVSETIENEAKERKGGFFGMLLGSLEDSLLVHLLISKGVKQSNIHGPGVMRGEEGRIKAGQYF